MIFLIACSAGEGKDLKRNIANHLLLEATDVRRGIVKRVVYAAQTFMSPKKIIIKSVYPFDVVTHGLFYLDKEGNKIPIYELKDRILHTFRQDLFTEDNTYRATLTQGIWLRSA